MSGTEASKKKQVVHALLRGAAFGAFMALMTVLLIRFDASRGAPDVPEEEERALVTVGDRTYQAEIADSDDERSLGLAGRDDLGESEGLLFLYEDDETATSFWMKDVPFPIDIVWVGDEEVVGVTRAEADDVSLSDEEKPRYDAPEGVRTVLEVAAGSGIEVWEAVTYETTF